MVFVALCISAVRAGMNSSEDEPWYYDPAARRVSDLYRELAANDNVLRKRPVRLRKVRCLLCDIRNGQDKRRPGAVPS